MSLSLFRYNWVFKCTIQSTDVRHLKDENHVLTEEIEQMTRQIDELSNGREGKCLFVFIHVITLTQMMIFDSSEKKKSFYIV